MTFKAAILHNRDYARPMLRDVQEIDTPMTVGDALKLRGIVDETPEGLKPNALFLLSTSIRQDTPEDIFILQDEWSRELLNGEALFIQTVPAGQNGSRIIALIAIAVLAFYTGGAAAAAYGPAAGAAAGALVSVAGAMLINALLPLPKPKAGNAETSPNYGIGADGNLARIAESIPVQYGRFKVSPDYAAQPYTETRNNNVFLYQLFCIGQGQYDIESIQIANTDISKYGEVQYEIIEPNQRVTLFPDNVVSSDSVQGIELIAPQDANTSSPDYSPYSGPFVCNPPGTQTTQLSIDISYPQGVFRINDKGNTKSQFLVWTFEYQLIDDDSNPVGPWVTLRQQAGETLYQSPWNFTINAYVPAGRYQVRASKGNYGESGSTHSTHVYWVGMRAYLPSQAVYGNVTMLAVVMQATNNLNGTSQHQISVTATRKIPIWNGSTWSAPTATRSIAWAFADIFRDTTYGRGFADDLLPLEQLLALDAVWTTRGDHFDGVFDTKTTTWEAAKAVARCGRAVPLYYAGVIDIVRDAPKGVRTLMITPNSIIQGSLSIQYLFPTQDTADYVIAQYIDPVTWKPASVDCAFDDSPKLNGRTVVFTGIIDRDHAFREGMYTNACNRDQRRVISLQTELAGLVPQYGDLVGLSHDVPLWGQSGVIKSIDPATGLIELSLPVRFSADQQHYIAIRARNGSGQGPYHCVEHDTTDGRFYVRLDVLTPEQIATIHFSDGTTEVPTAYAFGPASNQFLDCVLMSGKPSKDGKVALSLTNYAATVHLAETNTNIPPPGSPSGLVDPDISPGVSGIGKSEQPGGGEDGYTYISVDPIPGATAYEFEISYDGGVTWAYLGLSSTNAIRVLIPPGSWLIRARVYNFNSLPGAWTSSPIIIEGKPFPLGSPIDFVASTDKVFAINLKWDYPTDLSVFDAGSVEIRYGLTDVLVDSAILTTVAYPGAQYAMVGLPSDQSYYFWIRLLTKTTGDPGPEVGPVFGQSSNNAADIISYLNAAIGREQLTADLLTPIDSIGDLHTQLDDVAAQLDAVEGDFAELSGVIANFSPEFSGSTDDHIGSTTARIAVYSQIYAREQGDLILGGRIDTVAAELGDAAALVEAEALVRASADEALAQQTNTVQAQLGTTNATVQTQATAIADLNGKVSATYTIKLQATSGGKNYATGIALGIDPSSPLAQTEIIMQADLFSLISVSNGVITTPFTILGGQTYINSAFIQDASITNAKIGGDIQSSGVDSLGNPYWKLTRTGQLSINTRVGSAGNVLDGASLRTYDTAGTMRVRIGGW